MERLEALLLRRQLSLVLLLVLQPLAMLLALALALALALVLVLVLALALVVTPRLPHPLHRLLTVRPLSRIPWRCVALACACGSRLPAHSLYRRSHMPCVRPRCSRWFESCRQMAWF